jgi:hypothetical protein
MIVADHCKPGMYANKEGWIPQQPWADDVYVQWGGKGVVFSKSKGAYTTAFFEAFPKNHKTFIRGEGKDIAEAELDAFKQYQRHLACPNHEFEARSYTNGSGICKHCGLFMSKVFPPHLICKGCGKAIHEGITDINNDVYCRDCEDNIPEELWTKQWRDYIDEEKLREEMFGKEYVVKVKEAIRKAEEDE